MSQPKPSKVIIKNLQDIITNSKYSTSSLCGISNVNNFQNTQNSRLSSPKSKKHSIQPSLIKLQETPQKSINNKKYTSNLNSSLSKHSLKSKQKINIVSFCKDLVEKDNENEQQNQFSQTNSRINSNKKNNLIQSNISSSSTKKHHIPQTHNEKYSQPPTKIIQKKKKSITNPPLIDQILSSEINLNHFNQFHNQNQNHIKSLYFNQIDVIFTQLQDFLREIRQEFVNDFNFGDNDFNEPKENFFKQEKISKLEVLSEGFKEEVRKVFCENYNSQEFSSSKNLQSLFSKTTNSINSINHFTNPTKQTQPSYNPLFQQSKQKQRQAQTLQIQQFMQRQNTINSTILSPQDGQQSYLPTQTDTQLLSMLVFKNKVNNTKRKYQQHAGGNVNNSNSQNQVIISSRSGMNSNSNTSRKKNSKDKKECQYSFRNSKDLKQNVAVLKENPSSIRFNTNTKKQSQYSSRQKDEKYQTFTSSSDFTKKNYYKQTPVNKKKEHKQKNHHFYTQKPERSLQKQNMKPSYCTGFSATKSNCNWNAHTSKVNSKNTSLNESKYQRHGGIALVTTKKQTKQKSIYELVLEQNKKANKAHYLKTVA